MPSSPDTFSARWRTAPRSDSRAQLLFPMLADQPQPALDGRRGAAEPLGDLLVGVALHLRHRDGAQRVVAEAIEQPSAVFAHLGRERRVGLPAQQAGQEGSRRGGIALVFPLDLAPVALVPALVLDQIASFAGRDENQQLPEIVAVIEPGEAT